MGKYSFSDEQDKRREDRRPQPKPRKPILNKPRKVDAIVSTKVRGLINTESNKLVQNQAAENFQELQNFFAEAAKIIELKPYCWECGAFIPQKFYRAATAHVLPKRKEYGFPSLATNINNYLVLGAGCGCHKKYDNTWEGAATMKIFLLAIERFLILYPFIPSTERKNIPEVFLQEINKS